MLSLSIITYRFTSPTTSTSSPVPLPHLVCRIPLLSSPLASSSALLSPSLSFPVTAPLERQHTKSTSHPLAYLLFMSVIFWPRHISPHLVFRTHNPGWLNSRRKTRESILETRWRKVKVKSESERQKWSPMPESTQAEMGI